LPSDHPSPNHLLATLPAVDFELLRPHLRSFELKRDAVLLEVGDALASVYFIHSGVISSIMILAQGEMVEVSMVGRDGVFGASGAASEGGSATAAIVQLSGVASVIDVASFRIAREQSVCFRNALILQERFHFAELERAAACNAVHAVEARLSRLLLRLRDLSGDEVLQVTHECLAQMLGVQRNSISLAANALRQAGVISYCRGSIKIVDREALMGSSCECYGAAKARRSRILDYHQRETAKARPRPNIVLTGCREPGNGQPDRPVSLSQTLIHHETACDRPFAQRAGMETLRRMTDGAP
jgi:CRP-like cAMP-binding protein